MGVAYSKTGLRRSSWDDLFGAVCLFVRKHKRQRWENNVDKVDRTGLFRVTEGSGRQTEMDGGSWLRDHLWCSYDPLGQGTDRKIDRQVCVRTA